MDNDQYFTDAEARAGHGAILPGHVDGRRCRRHPRPIRNIQKPFAGMSLLGPGARRDRANAVHGRGSQLLPRSTDEGMAQPLSDRGRCTAVRWQPPRNWATSSTAADSAIRRPETGMSSAVAACCKSPEGRRIRNTAINSAFRLRTTRTLRLIGLLPRGRRCRMGRQRVPWAVLQ